MPRLTIVLAGPDHARAQVAAQAARTAALRGHLPGDAGIDVAAVAGGAAGLLPWLSQRGRTGPAIAIAGDFDAQTATWLLQSGVNAALLDQRPNWMLRHAAGVAMSGGVFLDPWLAHEVADLARPRRHNLHGVTRREQQVLVHAARGLDTSGIAEAVGLSPETVKGHMRSLQRRLGSGRRELIRTARAHGLLPSGMSRAESQQWDAGRSLDGLSVFVVGHERLARETLAGMLHAIGARVVGQGDSPRALRTASEEWMVTLAVSRDGAEELHRLRAAAPQAAVVVIPWNLSNHSIHHALAARAQGIVGINARLDELLAALRAAASGGLYLDPAALGVVLGDVADEAMHDGPLTARQRAVVGLVAQGYTNRQIARELGLAEPTVKGHVRSALRALGAADRHEAAEIAARKGIVPAVGGG